MREEYSKLINQDNFSFVDLSNIVNAFSTGDMSEDKMRNWIEKIYYKGMSVKESANYTQAIINSGVKLDFSELPGMVVDKHSTGGVGDKVSLILGPLLAAYGCYVPMIVGRSLGHTGGTLDKLESIPGYKPYLELEDFKKNIKNVGVSIMGQTKDICPADKKIYALRDKMNMIDSYPLICGSIMGKKIAEGIQGLVLDIKTGNGAFMNTLEKASKLGELLKKIGELNGLKVEVAITDMNQPLGQFSGIGCEVSESMESLKGNGPKDLMDIVFYLAMRIISVFKNDIKIKDLESLISSGDAFNKFILMVEAHGGSIREFERMEYQNPKFRYSIRSKTDGYLESFDTKKIGEKLSTIGAGRLGNSDGIDCYSGLRMYKKISDSVIKDEPIIEFYCSSEKKINNLSMEIDSLFKVSKDKCDAPALIY
tara:strand:+ start:1131 stop:2402 length:1272 start_codon:yes stop_codon:yes gene_type:complete